MKLLYLSLDPPLDVHAIATGNQVRAQGIRDALEAAGHHVTQISPSSGSPGAGQRSDVYYSAAGLVDHIRQSDYEGLVVAYWSTLADLPELDIPVVLDFIAPRLLEQMYQDPAAVIEQSQLLISLLRRADHFLVGNQRQADLLLGLLLQAGFDCRQHSPVSIVPISARGSIKSLDVPFPPLRVVNAGVDWPWRDFSAYAKVLENFGSTGPRMVFSQFTGAYPGTAEAEEESGLLTYSRMQEALRGNHIGLELGEKNTEREFSHSFRVVEYFQCGLPVIINQWIPLAEQVRRYNAGWVISDTAQLRPLLEEVLDNPDLLAAKRAGVERLVSQFLNYRVSCVPLLDYLAAPGLARRIVVPPETAEKTNGPVEPAETEQANDLPAKKETDVSGFKLILASIFKKLFCPKRPQSTPDILMVTRADLFPVDHGAAVKIIRTAEALSRQGRDVWLVTDSRRKYYQFCAGEMITHRFPLLVSLVSLPRPIAFMRLVNKGFPVSNSFLYLPVTDASYIARVVYLTSRKPIGAYQAEFPAYVRPCRFARSLFGGKILLVQHNVEYDRIRNQVLDLTKRNIETLRNLELLMCRIADNIVAVSENDRQKMIRDGIDAEKIHTIPHGVDLLSFRESTPINIKAHYGLPNNDRVLVYHGTYSYSPNLEAMEVMAREILPRLEARGLEVSVLAIGSKPPNFPLHEKIIFAGSVDDLSEVIPAADLAVVPLMDGGGTRMKILDYFAAGVPVISTAKGIEGIPVEHGREALIIDDYDDICAAIENLLANPDEAAKLSEAASHFVDNLGWDAVVRRYLPLLQ